MSSFKFYISRNTEIISITDTRLGFGYHSHSSDYVMTYITSGEAVLQKGGADIFLTAGDSFMIFPYESHALFSEKPVSIVSFCIKKDAVSSCETEDNDPLRKVRMLIEKQPESNEPIAEYAKAAFMSKYRFIGKFCGIAGLTPHKFRIQCRIRKAQSLLLNGKSVIEAALETGFYDQSHFDRCFKKTVGISPADYISSAIFYKP